MKQQTKIGILLLAAMAAAPAPGWAGEQEWRSGGKAETVTGHLDLSGIDLATDAGKALARKRIRQAAGRLCDAPGGSPLAVTLDGAACRRRVVQNAESQVERLLRLSAVHRVAAR